MIKQLTQLLLISSVFTFSVPTLAKGHTSPETTPPRPTKAINLYIDRLVQQHHFNKKQLTDLIKRAKYNPNIIHSITHPFEKKPWNFYRRYFVRPDRIKNGIHYWETHKKILNDIKNQYGIPPSIVIAIIGIESFFGEKSGTYNELNALTTLSFYYPKRQKFFQSELTHFLLLARQEKLDPTQLKGSYAGALGIPQFMPSSYRYYGVGYSKKQSVNLFTNHGDAIASIGNYLAKSGWTSGQPIAIPAKITGKSFQSFISKTAKPKYTLAKLRRHHIRPIKKEPKHLKAALIAMKNTNSTEYWLVFQNFHAIMKYNPRTTYALAVYELSQAIKKAHEKYLATTSTTTAPSGKVGRS